MPPIHHFFRQCEHTTMEDQRSILHPNSTTPPLAGLAHDSLCQTCMRKRAFLSRLSLIFPRGATAALHKKLVVQEAHTRMPLLFGFRNLPFYDSSIPLEKKQEYPHGLYSQNLCLFYLSHLPFHKRRLPLPECKLPEEHLNPANGVLRICGHAFDALAEDDRRCDICYELFLNEPCHYPIQLPCGHILAQDCLKTWFSEPGQSTCPFCRNKYTRRQIVKWFPQLSGTKWKRESLGEVLQDTVRATEAAGRVLEAYRPFREAFSSFNLPPVTQVQTRTDFRAENDAQLSYPTAQQGAMERREEVRRLQAEIRRARGVQRRASEEDERSIEEERGDQRVHFMVPLGASDTSVRAVSREEMTLDEDEGAVDEEQENDTLHFLVSSDVTRGSPQIGRTAEVALRLAEEIFVEGVEAFDRRLDSIEREISTLDGDIEVIGIR